MVWLMLCDHPWVQQCITSNLQSWYWHIVSLVNPWFFLFTSTVFSYWSSSAQQPADQFNQRMAGVLSDHVCVWFLCPMEINRSSTMKPRWGGVVLGYGCSYWLVLCVLCTVLMGCYTSNPMAVWPWSSHTLTLRSTQQQGCGNQCQIFFPLQRNGTASVCWSRKPCQIFLWSVSLIVLTSWHENKAFHCAVYLQVLKILKANLVSSKSKTREGIKKYFFLSV